MNTKVYVDNLVADMTETDLLALFSPYGNVMSVNIPADRQNHRRKGFAFVTMVTPEGALSAIRGLNGKVIGNCTLIASEAWPNEEGAILSSAGRTPRRSPSCLF